MTESGRSEAVGTLHAIVILDVPDLDAAVSRVQELGGRKLRQLKEYGIEWVVMADPNGNEFCLVKHPG